MSKKLTLEEFIKRAKEIHGDKYDYSKVEYKSMHDKVCIICKEHGEFWQTPSKHFQGQGCAKCSQRSYAYTTEEWIIEARKVHCDKYNYSKVEYIDAHTKVCIICPKHGEFWQKPNNHLNGQGCPLCNGKNSATDYKVKGYTNVRERGLKKLIDFSKNIHGDNLLYGKIRYNDNRTKVEFVCRKHGSFFQSPFNHYRGHSCPKCALGKQIKTKKQFIEEAIFVHGNRYDYSKLEYKGVHEKICIICSEHDEFWQTPSAHLQGQGCPICKSSLLENEIRLFLTNNNIEFVEQFKETWLGKQSLDFYLPKYNIAIECQGIQHFKSIDYFGGEECFNSTIERDERKKMLCEQHGIKLLYYSNLGIEYPYKVIENKEELLKEILNN